MCSGEQAAQLWHQGPACTPESPIEQKALAVNHVVSSSSNNCWQTKLTQKNEHLNMHQRDQAWANIWDLEECNLSRLQKRTTSHHRENI